MHVMVKSKHLALRLLCLLLCAVVLATQALTACMDSPGLITEDPKNPDQTKNPDTSSTEDSGTSNSENPDPEPVPLPEPDPILAFVSNGDGTCYVSGIGTCTGPEIIIPEVSPDGDAVTGIGAHAFENQQDITAIVIPESVTTIGAYAFFRCSQLQSIQIPQGVTEISTGMLGGCSSLTCVSLPEGITSLSDRAFADCASLTEITIPGIVTVLGEQSFLYCSTLSKINFTGTSEQWTAVEKVEGWDDGAGSYTVYCLDGEIAKEQTTLSLEYTSNGDGTCYVSGLGEYTYETPKIIISQTAHNGDIVTGISDSAFAHQACFTDILIPRTVTSIAPGAFNGCDGLSGLTVAQSNPIYHSVGNCIIETASKTLVAGCMGSVIPDDGSVTSIGDLAFYLCYNLTSLHIPQSVTQIASQALCGSMSLESITVEKGNPTYHSVGNCLIETASKTLLLGCKNSIIPTDGSITTIAMNAFQRSQLTSLSIPEGVTAIRNMAFFDCPALASIELPHSLTTIGFYLFNGCNNLTSIHFAGTLDEWLSVQKMSEWDTGTGDYTIYCTDGTVAKDGTIS